MNNVIYDPWIKAKTFDGQVKMIGIKEAIVNADKYKCISMANEDPMYEYCVYRLLGGFVQAAYHIDYQIEWLEDKILFDEKTFDKYIADCIESGTSFDVFDKEKPFMQLNWNQFPDSAKKYIDMPLEKLSEIKQKVKAEKPSNFIKPVSKISLYDVSATNRVFGYQLNKNARKYMQTHKNSNVPVENQCELSKKDFFLNLLVTQLGLTPAGSSASVTKRTGSGPVYFIIQGKNLWETLLLNCGDNYDGVPIWEWKTYAPEMYCVDNSGWLTELFIPCRNIRFGGISESGMVTTVYFEDRKFKEYRNGIKLDSVKTANDPTDDIRKAWISTDPYIMTYRNKKDDLMAYSFSDDSVKTNEGYDFMLKYFGQLALGNYPKNYMIVDELESKNHLRINAYYQYEKDKGNIYYGSHKKEYPLVPNITKNANERKSLKRIVNYIENVGKTYEKQLSLMAKIMSPGDKNIISMLKETYARPFYSIMQDMVTDNCINYINDENNAIDELASIMSDVVTDANTDLVNRWIMDWFEKVQVPVLNAIEKFKEDGNE